MVLWITSFLFFGLGGILCANYVEKRNTFRMKASFFVAGLCLGLLFNIVSSLMLSEWVLFPYSFEQSFEVKRIYLIALYETGNSKETVFLASESFNSERYYTFYYYDKDGKRELAITNDGEVTINEQDRRDAYLTVEGKRKVYPEWVNLYLIPRFFTEATSNIAGKQKKYIYVPKGTVKLGYEFKFKG